VFQQRDLGPNVVQIVDRQTDLRSSLCASCLQFGASGKDEYEVGPERTESGPQSTLEARPVGQEEHDRRNAPSHSKHGKHAAAPVVAQRVVSLSGEISDHKKQLSAISRQLSALVSDEPRAMSNLQSEIFNLQSEIFNLKSSI
jgi:hypothetical protein